MGYLNLKPEQTNLFFKLMEERYNKHSTILTVNQPEGSTSHGGIDPGGAGGHRREGAPDPCALVVGAGVAAPESEGARWRRCDRPQRACGER
jgi:hypothetical protein